MTEDADSKVEEFFDIESDLRNLTETGVATSDVTDVDSGTVMGVERVSTTAVPDEYPIQTTGERALAIEVEFDVGRKTTVFIDWPDEGADVEQIERLLDVADVSFDSFADIYGESIPLEVRDEYLVVPVHSSAEPAADSSASEYASSSWLGTTLLSGLWTWAAVELILGDGLTLIGWASWAVVAAFLLAWAEMDRLWVAKTTNWTPDEKWTTAITLFPLAALPVYLFNRFAACYGS